MCLSTIKGATFLLQDFFFYKGICEVKATEPISNIITARIDSYHLHSFISFENNTLRIQNQTSTTFTCRELLFDLLLFINKYATINFLKPLHMEKKLPIAPNVKKNRNDNYLSSKNYPILEKNTKETSEHMMYTIFKHQNTLYLYSLNKKTGKESTSPLLHEFLHLKNHGLRFIYLNDYTLNIHEKRILEIGGVSVPLFEPFMKQAITLQEIKYVPKHKNLLLEDQTRKDACFACVHRMRNISNGGCVTCVPSIREKKPEER